MDDLDDATSCLVGDDLTLHMDGHFMDSFLLKDNLFSDPSFLKGERTGDSSPDAVDLKHDSSLLEDDLRSLRDDLIGDEAHLMNFPAADSSSLEANPMTDSIFLRDNGAGTSSIFEDDLD